jgi:hypothetical protein
MVCGTLRRKVVSRGRRAKRGEKENERHHGSTQQQPQNIHVPTNLLSALGLARAARGMARFCSLPSSGPLPHSYEFQIWVSKCLFLHAFGA